MTLSDYAENKVLEHVLGKTSFTMPANPYHGLYQTANPTDGSGTEMSGNGYSRIAAAGTVWGTASAGSISNTSQLQYAAAATAAWTIHGWGEWDASTAGNSLIWGLVTDSNGTEITLTVNIGDQVTFASGALVVTCD